MTFGPQSGVTSNHLLAWNASAPRDQVQHDTDEGSGVLTAPLFTFQMGNTTDT